MRMISALEVAKMFIKWGADNGDSITNLKMQKLLYYAQAWHLVNFGKRLFFDPIEAWEFGPVVSNVYHSFKKHGYDSLPIPKSVSNIEERLKKGQLKYLKELFLIFNDFSATALVSMTHSESPWKDNFKKGYNNEIPVPELKSFYTKMYDKQNG
ncbi:MAG: DUF4065 domain-containing protein [Candidatus Zixiibacteriota bacterium]